METRIMDHTSAPPPGTSSANAIAESDVSRLLHQLNQPLTAISNYARAGIQLIDKGMSDTAHLKELFEKIAAQSARTTACSHDLGTALSKLTRRDEQ